jgi:hypothetical protein
LKPDCFPQTDGGRMGSAASRARKHAMPYLVRMIKPNLIFSHDWHVQPNCQRSLRALRLSGALLDRGPAFRPGCPRTCSAPPFSHRNASIGVFARTFQTYRTSPRLSSLTIFFARGRSNSLLAGFPRCESDQPDWERPVQKPRTAQNIKE